MRKAFTILAVLSLAVVIGIPLATVGPAQLAKPAPVAAAPARTVTAEDIRKQWGGTDKPKAVEHVGTVQERARWACSEALERIAVDPKSLRWTRRSQWVSVETAPGVWQVHAHFMARNRLGNDVAATAACTLRFSNDTFTLIKG